MIRPYLRLILLMFGLLCFAGTLSRLAFGLYFQPPQSTLFAADWLPALWLGFRFDARVAVDTMALAWALSLLPWLARRWIHPPQARWLWLSYWLLACWVWLMAAIVDAGHYAYLTLRLSAVVVTLAHDAREAAGMVWQTYPVVWISLAALFTMGVAYSAFRWMWTYSLQTQATQKKMGWKSSALHGLAVVFALFIVHGKFSQYPLRWSDAVELPQPFAQTLAQNPLHNLYDTWSFKNQQLTDQAMRPDADRIRSFVGLPPLKVGEPISFLRTLPAKLKASDRAPPNVVLVLMESFAAHKTGAFGNPLGATPVFDRLAKDGLLFTRMMSAHAHTARGVFATLTGIPDVSVVSTASRNPAASNQQSIVNEFKPHQKLYFMGGSTSWANIRGLLTSSIDDIEIIEQAQLNAPIVDVWGVSDKNVLLAAHEKFKGLAAQSKPFFAVVQTSGNHRPYSIPAEDFLGHDAFKPPTPSEQQLTANGFISLKEFHSFAYLDWCVGRFMQAASKEVYFENTIFAFVGDHGIIGKTNPLFPAAWHDLAITQGHTPFLIYAPKHVRAERKTHWAQQVDVLPTLASLAGIGYRNTTLGRDLLDSRFDNSRVAFTFMYMGEGQTGTLVDDYYLLNRKAPAGMSLYDIQSKQPLLNLLSQPAHETGALSASGKIVYEQWAPFIQAYNNAALYLQTHNHKLRAKK